MIASLNIFNQYSKYLGITDLQLKLRIVAEFTNTLKSINEFPLIKQFLASELKNATIKYECKSTLFQNWDLLKSEIETLDNLHFEIKSGLQTFKNETGNYYIKEIQSISDRLSTLSDIIEVENYKINTDTLKNLCEQFTCLKKKSSLFNLHDFSQKRLKKANDLTNETISKILQTKEKLIFNRTTIESIKRKNYFVVRYCGTSIHREAIDLKHYLPVNAKSEILKLQKEIIEKGDLFAKNTSEINVILQNVASSSKNELLNKESKEFYDLPIDIRDSYVPKQQPIFINLAGIKSCYNCNNRKYITCNHCNGKHQLPCDRCSGKGKINCGNCSGVGKIRCSKCTGSGTNTCSTCGGTGIKDDKICKKCNNGKVTCHETSFFISTPTCNGTGKVDCPNCYSGQVTCSTCTGSGIIYCQHCYGDQNNHEKYGKIDCPSCRAFGEIGYVTFIESNVFYNGEPQYNEKYYVFDESLNYVSNFEKEAQILSQNHSKTNVNVTVYQNANKTVFNEKDTQLEVLTSKIKQLSLQSTKLIQEVVYYECVPCIELELNEILTNTAHKALIIGIDEKQDTFFYSKLSNLETKSKNGMANLSEKLFSGREFNNRKDNYNLVVLMLFVMFENKDPTPKQKVCFSSHIGNKLDNYTKEEQQILLDILQTNTLPIIKDDYLVFSTKENLTNAKNKLNELVSLGMGVSESSTKIIKSLSFKEIGFFKTVFR